PPTHYCKQTQSPSIASRSLWPHTAHRWVCKLWGNITPQNTHTHTHTHKHSHTHTHTLCADYIFFHLIYILPRHFCRRGNLSLPLTVVSLFISTAAGLFVSSTASGDSGMERRGEERRGEERRERRREERRSN